MLSNAQVTVLRAELDRRAFRRDSSLHSRGPIAGDVVEEEE